MAKENSAHGERKSTHARQEMFHVKLFDYVRHVHPFEIDFDDVF